MFAKVYFVPLLLLIVCYQPDSFAKSTKPVELFSATDNRAMVQQVQYAYYPDSGELRIRLVLENREVKSGRFVDARAVNHLLKILTADARQLLCVYEGNSILSIAMSRDL